MAMLTVVGCSNEETSSTSADVVSVVGTVTLNGKPLPGAVVTFLPETGGPGLSDTDEAGKYALESSGSPGVALGKYKVSISYLAPPDGAPQSLADRSSIVQSSEMLAAKEQLPSEYSDLGRTKLAVEVTRKNRTFDFDIKAPDLVLKPPSQNKAAAEPPNESDQTAGAAKPPETQAEAPVEKGVKAPTDPSPKQ